MTETTASDAWRSDLMPGVWPRAAGLDVHKMQITASVRLCEPGGGAPRTAVREFSALPLGLEELTAWLQAHSVTAAAMEGTGVYWKAPYEALEDAGIQPYLLHTQHGQQIRGRKTDANDSLWLARICQFGLALPSYVPPRAFRQLRQLSRYRRKLVSERRRLRNRVHKTLDHDGVRLGGILSDLFGRNGRHILDGLVASREPTAFLAELTPHVRPKLALLAEALTARLDPDSLWRLRDQLAACDHVDRSLAELDGRLAVGLADHAEALRLLQTVPGLDFGSAAAILIEIGPDLTAFREPRHLGAWAGVAPGNHESAGKRRSGRARKGNAALRATLAECAHGAARSQGTQFHSYPRALAARLGYKRAILATAHKLLRTIYAVLRDRQPDRDPQVNYEQVVVDRNAPRWLRMLKRYGYLPTAEAAPAA